MFKDDACVQRIKEFIDLRSNVYSFKLAGDEHIGAVAAFVTLAPSINVMTYLLTYL